MKKLIITTLILTLLAPSIIGTSRPYATKTAYAADEPIECDGDTVEYFETEKKVVGKGDVVITYKDMKLTSDKVTIWTETYSALAEGNVTLTQGDNIFKGEKIEYNFKENSGSVVDFWGTAEQWYVRGKEAKQLSEDEVIVRKSYVTTCDHEIPHWKISADRVEIYPGKVLNTYNAIAWINPLSKKNLDIPVMWLPYYCHPLDDNRPQVTLVPGKSSEWGYYLLTAWGYHLSPNQKGYVHIDYREKKDLALGLDYIYDTQLIGKGNLFGYSVNERGVENNYIFHKWFGTGKEYDEYKYETEKYILRERHQWQATPQTLVTAEFHKYQDRDVIKDYFFDDYEKDEHPLTYALATHNMNWATASLLAQKRVNTFDDVTEMLPEAKLNVHNQKIGNSRFYYKGDFKAVNMNQLYSDNIKDSQHANIFDTYNQLSYPLKLAFLSVTPYVGTKQTFLSREIDNDNSIISGAAYSGVDVSTRFYKVLDIQGTPLGMEINKIRHVVTPTFGYGYISDPTKNANRMLSDGVSKSSVISLGLENKLQTKRGADENVVDLATLLVNTTYDLTRTTTRSQFKDFTGKLELRPYSWLTATSDAIIDGHKLYNHQWLKQINNNVYFNFKDKGSLGIGHSYQAGANNMIAQAKLGAIPGWGFSAYWDFDFLATRDGEKISDRFKEQEYVITKDLHCWEVDLRYNIRKEYGHEVMLVFRLKAFPDMPLRIGKTYKRPKIGEQSGD
jgi:lipopolysaccharide assembly outer membrane protein LptD (OstA)